MKTGDIVRKLDLGNSVAEFDNELEKYFVETEPFRALVQGRADVIAGDKGTGKTALYKILRKRYGAIEQLKNVEVVTAFNPSGNPVFQRLAQQEVLTEAQYVAVWKAYVLSLVGNWLLGLYDGDGRTDKMHELHDLLKRTALLAGDDSPSTVFSKIMNAIARVFPDSAEVTMTLSETGIPIIVPKVGLARTDASPELQQEVPHEQALDLLNAALNDADFEVWVVLDRLDEAFQGCPSTETPALRALFRTYLDLLEFPKVKLKFFVRRDLFRKITQGGFVNLTHVNARKVEIIWEEEDLMNLLCRRIREVPMLLTDIGAQDASDQELFDCIFPEKVDDAERKPTTWRWIMARIRDGNDVKPPRNLIDLVSKAREAQLRREDRESRDFVAGQDLIEPDSIRRALRRLSTERVEDTLLAEAGEFSALIEKFRDGKSEHNQESIAKQLGISEAKVKATVKPLVELGVLETVGDSYKIPMLYRDGLGITQGKAFEATRGVH